MNVQAQALAQAGRRLHEEAREHMRSARYHRRRAAQLHRDVEALRVECAALGIALVLQDDEPDHTKPHRRPSDDRHAGS